MSSAENNDRKLIDYLRDQDGGSVGDLMEVMQVTATAVRLRLNRLMEKGYIERRLDREAVKSSSGRGRPSYRYHVSDKGAELSGTNYMDLAQVMWKEIRAIKDPELRDGMVARLAVHMADRYRSQPVEGLANGEGLSEEPTEKSLTEKMQEVIGVLNERDFRINMVEEEGSLPVLNVLSCPYPNLAQQDSSICELETLMLSELLGEKVELDSCRLEGNRCCSFQAPEDLSSAISAENNGAAKSPTIDTNVVPSA